MLRARSSSSVRALHRPSESRPWRLGLLPAKSRSAPSWRPGTGLRPSSAIDPTRTARSRRPSSRAYRRMVPRPGSILPKWRRGQLEHGRQDHGDDEDRQRDQQGRSDELELDRPYVAGARKRPLRPKGDPRTRGATRRTTCTRPRPDPGRSRALAGRPSPPGRHARRPATASVVADEPHLKPRCSRAGLAHGDESLADDLVIVDDEDTDPRRQSGANHGLAFPSRRSAPPRAPSQGRRVSSPSYARARPGEPGSSPRTPSRR